MLKQVFSVDSPFDTCFAEAGRRGTWYPDPGPGICPKCTASRQMRISPLVMEWEPGSDVIADFTWPGPSDVVVTGRVRDALESRFVGFEFGPVEMRQDPRLKRPQRITKRTRPRVWLPYSGPTLWDLRTPTVCKLDVERSTITIERVCGTCGRVIFSMPHRSLRHLVVDRLTWQGQHAFTLDLLPGVQYVTGEVKDLIEASDFSNIRFFLEGEIPD